MRVVFLGGGRITSAMLAGLRTAKTKHHLVVHDRNLGKLLALKKRYAITPESNLQNAVQGADLLLIAVRPDAVGGLLRAIENAGPLLAVSLAAGIPLRVLNKALGPPVCWARAMPSPVSRSRAGLTALTFAQEFSKKGRKVVRELFANVGQVVEVPERRFDAFTVTYSSSHGYHAFATLAAAAEAIGLDRKTALLASAHALADGITAWRNGKVSLEALLEEATTPGGIAASTIAAMDAAGYARAVRKGVVAGLRRARSNARQ